MIQLAIKLKYTDHPELCCMCSFDDVGYVAGAACHADLLCIVQFIG